MSFTACYFIYFLNCSMFTISGQVLTLAHDLNFTGNIKLKL
jgi:hypothetical protein